MGIIISDEIEKECLNLLALYTDREYYVQTGRLKKVTKVSKDPKKP